MGDIRYLFVHVIVFASPSGVLFLIVHDYAVLVCTVTMGYSEILHGARFC